jgi:Tfp pilus assembly protein PilX
VHSRTSRSRRRQRGSGLILAVIILAVLAMLAAAALQIAQQEAATVSRHISYEMMVSCAEAAQSKLWAEYAKYNTTTQVVPTVVPGTNTKLQLGHYPPGDPPTAVNVTFDESAMKPLDPNVISGGLRELDQTNTFRKGLLGQPYQIFAHCFDDRGRQYEVELLVRFGL